jgi:mannose-1-phosphate guanylyltransferase
MSQLWAVLMAGGSGTRFWPASRADRPKQLLPLGGEQPLLLRTAERLAGLVPPERQLVITNARYVAAIRDMLPDVPPDQVVGEPEGRDTAACIGLAAALLERLDPDAIGVAMPSDHVLSPEQGFREHLAAATEALEVHPNSVLVFGIGPDRPATGFGYLRCGARVGTYGGHDVHRLAAFVEKPDRRRAESLLAQGDVYWNAGMFAFRPGALTAAYAEHLPAMGEPLARIASAWRTPEFERVLGAEYPCLQRVSIDYGVMEKLADVLLMPMPLRWEDVGAWDALARLLPPDADGNVVQGEVLALGSKGSILSATGGMVAVKGIEDLIVVHTPDATLVCRRDDAEGVKAIVAALSERGFDSHT